VKGKYFFDGKIMKGQSIADCLLSSLRTLSDEEGSLTIRPYEGQATNPGASRYTDAAANTSPFIATDQYQAGSGRMFNEITGVLKEVVVELKNLKHPAQQNGVPTSIYRQTDPSRGNYEPHRRQDCNTWNDHQYPYGRAEPRSYGHDFNFNSAEPMMNVAPRRPYAR
jgi:hypothetical protein